MSETNINEMILAILSVILIISLVAYVLRVIAQWQIFKKAGEAGWKTLIPFYNAYVQFRLTWSTKWFWVMIVLALDSSVLSSSGLAEKNELLYYFTLFLESFAAFIIIYDMCMLARSFGKGIGFSLGLIFFNPIFTMILAFNSSIYYYGNGYELSRSKPEEKDEY